MILTFILVYAEQLNAEIPSVEWEATFGGSQQDLGIEVIETSDLGFAIAGITTSYGAGSWDYYLVKTDADGAYEWSQVYGGPESEECGSFQQTPDGGFVLFGYTQSYGAGNTDFWLVRTNSSGDQLWGKTYGGSESDIARCGLQTSDGGFIIAGWSNSYGAGLWDMYVVKTDSIGNVQWDTTVGGPDQDLCYAIDQTSDGGYILSGATGSYGSGYHDVFLVKLEPTGAVSWEKTLGGTDWDYCFSVDAETDGGFFLAGRTKSFGSGDYDAYLIKTDSEGNVEWDYASGESGFDTADCGIEISSGGYLSIGYVDTEFETLCLTKFSSLGQSEWELFSSGLDHASGASVSETSDNGFIVAGSTREDGGWPDFYLLKLSPETQIGETQANVLSSVSFSLRSPCPFSEYLQIDISVDSNVLADILVVDVSGRVVDTIIENATFCGESVLVWEPPSSVPSGVYTIVFDAGEHSAAIQTVRLL